MGLWQSVKKAAKKKVAAAKKSRAEDKKIYDEAYKSAKVGMIKKRAKRAAAQKYFPQRRVTISGGSPLQQIISGGTVKVPKLKITKRKRRKKKRR